MAVALLSLLYGFVGLAATFNGAFESIFSRRGFSVLETSGGWISLAAVVAIALVALAMSVGALLRDRRIIKTCVDLFRLNLAALLGALIPCAVGSAHPRIATPLALGLTSLTLAFDRWIDAEKRPWQTWALASLALLVALPILLLSRL
jgi:hypothetical protein